MQFAGSQCFCPCTVMRQPPDQQHTTSTFGRLTIQPPHHRTTAPHQSGPYRTILGCKGFNQIDVKIM